MHHSNTGTLVPASPAPTTLNSHSMDRGRMTNQQKNEMEKKLHEQVMKTIDETFGKEI